MSARQSKYVEGPLEDFERKAWDNCGFTRSRAGGARTHGELGTRAREAAAAAIRACKTAHTGPLGWLSRQECKEPAVIKALDTLYNNQCNDTPVLELRRDLKATKAYVLKKRLGLIKDEISDLLDKWADNAERNFVAERLDSGLTSWGNYANLNEDIADSIPYEARNEMDLNYPITYSVEKAFVTPDMQQFRIFSRDWWIHYDINKSNASVERLREAEQEERVYNQLQEINEKTHKLFLSIQNAKNTVSNSLQQSEVGAFRGTDHDVAVVVTKAHKKLETLKSLTNLAKSSFLSLDIKPARVVDLHNNINGRYKQALDLYKAAYQLFEEFQLRNRLVLETPTQYESPRRTSRSPGSVPRVQAASRRAIAPDANGLPQDIEGPRIRSRSGSPASSRVGSLPRNPSGSGRRRSGATAAARPASRPRSASRRSSASRLRSASRRLQSEDPHDLDTDPLGGGRKQRTRW